MDKRLFKDINKSIREGGKLLRDKKAKKALEKMKVAATRGEAEEILCTFLEELGYKELVEEYRGVDRWGDD